jgi:hypothetical protein
LSGRDEAEHFPLHGEGDCAESPLPLLVAVLHQPIAELHQVVMVDFIISSTKRRFGTSPRQAINRSEIGCLEMVGSDQIRESPRGLHLEAV